MRNFVNSVNKRQGPGQNTNYYLITTGLDSDPTHGTIGYNNYNAIKNVISLRAEIIFENTVIRKFSDIVTNTYLKGYGVVPRTVYQVLLGTVRYSDPWNCKELQEAIGNVPLTLEELPNNNEYSIDFIASIENGMKLNQAVTTPSLLWKQNNNFFYSELLPFTGIGVSGDVWMVSINNSFELHYQPAYSWLSMSNYINMTSQTGRLFIGSIPPVVQANSWWLDTTGIVIRKFSTSINNWEASTLTIVSDIEPTTSNVGDLWLKPIFGKIKLFVFNGIRYIPAIISKQPVQDVLSNSKFVGDLTKNNYVVECNDSSLMGGVLSNVGNSSMIKIYNEGIIVGDFNSINFLGNTVNVTNNTSTGHADVTSSGDSVFSFNDTIILNNQIAIQLPAQTITIIEFAVNGVETTAFTFDLLTKQIMFNSIQANYTLEVGDSIHVIFKDV